MRTTAMYQHDDWYLIELPGYGDIPKNELQVDINVTDKDLINMDYKALRGAMIMERYLEKQEKNIVAESLESYQSIYFEQLNIVPVNSMDELMSVLTTIPKRNDIYTR
jgi:hypothetical protein